MLALGDLRVVEVEREVEPVVLLADSGLHHDRLGRFGRGERHAVASARTVAGVQRHGVAEVRLPRSGKVRRVPVHAEAGALGPRTPRGNDVTLCEVEGQVERRRVRRLFARHLHNGVFHAVGFGLAAKIDLPAVPLATHQLYAADGKALERNVPRRFGAERREGRDSKRTRRAKRQHLFHFHLPPHPERFNAISIPYSDAALPMLTAPGS